VKHVALSEPDQDVDDVWYLVQLKPGGFVRAQTNLTRQGFETFMPLRPETRRRAGQLRTEQRPLFPGYLFVRVDPASAPWRKINSTYGVARLVSLSGRGPTRVPLPLVRALMRAAGEGSCVLDTSNFKVGASVSLISGPFAGALVRIAAAPEDGRVHVLMEMMGQAVRTAVPVRAVEFAGAPAS
jgi:transcriptional antiterminator RfaH